MKSRFSSKGFTIVELLIVIVVIAILAAITIVAYNGIQARARDAQRESDVKTIVKALELYYIDNGKFPTSSCSSSCVVNTYWSDSADVGWQALQNQLVPMYISALPKDPTNNSGYVLNAGPYYNYAYFSGGYCGVAQNQMYILAWKYEGSGQKNTLIGDCTTSPLGPYAAASNYRVVK